MERLMDISSLTLEELAGVVNIYPWFSLARKELCRRMAGTGEWGLGQFADAAMYMGDRRVLSSLMRGMASVDCSDGDIEAAASRFVTEQVVSRPATPAVDYPSVPQSPKPRFAGADYFSLDEYASVRRQDDSSIIDYNATVSDEQQRTLLASQDRDADVCTETLARIYLEQGYPSEAKAIYSKLILAYPEKSAYFAALIEKIDEIKN